MTTLRAALLSAVLVLTLLCGVGELRAAAAREGYSKVLISKRVLFKLPDATAPPILAGLDATVLEDYEDYTLASVRDAAVAALQTRAKGPGIEIIARPDFDHVYINGSMIDARLGVRASLPGRSFDPAYLESQAGLWIVQFVGPIKPEWLDRARGEGLTLAQYLPYNAYLAAGTSEAIRRVETLPYVQLVEQLHKFMKPAAVSQRGQAERLWVQLVDIPESDDALSLLKKLSAEETTDVARFSGNEIRVESLFDGGDIDRILSEPLVVSVSRRPTIELSDERSAVSLTGLPTSPSSAGRYKKWLSDICEGCLNLFGNGYYIGIADTGIDGGRTAASASTSSPGEPNASGNHRLELRSERIEYGTSFEQTGPPSGPAWAPQYDQYPDSTGTLHDVRGHGTLVAGVAAGDGTPAGAVGGTDADGFFYGMGIAPSAGLVITKINPTFAAAGSTAITTIAKDARMHPVQPASIQNHSYNQYQGLSDKACSTYFDGYYSVLSREFDRAVRDADTTALGDQSILLTVSAGNVNQQGYPDSLNPSGGCRDRFLTLPPATAKNVLALGMAENVRPDSAAWRCAGALAQSHDNIAGNTKTGTKNSEWFKPDLMATAGNVSASKSHDESVSAEFCQNGQTPPAIPAEYFASTGTSFAAPVGAGAALLASRYYSLWKGGSASALTASPALLKAMLIAGARSMQGGNDRSHVTAWRRSLNRAILEGALVIPSTPNGHVYKARNYSGYTGNTEPSPWPIGQGTWVQETGTAPNPPQIWDYLGPETMVGALPNGRQGFGRINLVDVLSTYPSRDFINQEPPALNPSGSWPKGENRARLDRRAWSS